MKKLIFLVQIMVSATVLGQNTKVILSESCPIHELHGTIDGQYEVTLYLDFVNYETVSGYYFYNKIKKAIPIIGKVDFSREEVAFFELDESYEKRAKFTGKLSGRKKIKGSWVDFGKKDTLTFELVRDKGSLQPWCDFAFQLSKRYNPPNSAPHFKRCYVDIPGMECKISSEDYSIVFEKEVNENIYLVIHYSHPSVGCASGRGYCGAGYEDGFVWLEIDKDEFFIQKIQRFLFGSCLKGINCENFKKTISSFEDRTEPKVYFDCLKIFVFDKNNPELGIFKK